MFIQTHRGSLSHLLLIPLLGFSENPRDDSPPSPYSENPDRGRIPEDGIETEQIS